MRGEKRRMVNLPPVRRSAPRLTRVSRLRSHPRNWTRRNKYFHAMLVTVASQDREWSRSDVTNLRMRDEDVIRHPAESLS